MASVFIVSHRTAREQARALRTFLSLPQPRLSLPQPEISEQAAHNIVKLLQLNKPFNAGQIARRLRAALLAHGIAISHQASLEALARACGESDWTQAKQRALPFENPNEHFTWCFQVVNQLGPEEPTQLATALGPLANKVLKIVRARWPAECAPAVCTLNVGPHAMTLDFEHPNDAWFTIQIWRCRITPEGASLVELPDDEVRRFAERMQCALEHAHHGLLVLGALRSKRLPPWYHFLPIIRQPTQGINLKCSGEMEIFTAFDNLRIAEDLPTRSDSIAGTDGPVPITCLWASGVDGDEKTIVLEPDLIRLTAQRTARIRRVTGLNLLRFFVRVLSGTENAADFVQFNRSLFEKHRTERGLDTSRLAELTGLTVNVCQRLQKYGWAHVSAIPKLALAFGIADPNALLALSDEGIGVRIERGDQFMRTLEKTHWWKVQLGDGLQGEEAETVQAIAEDLREHVDLLQFSRSPFIERNESGSTADEGRLAAGVQELLDQLSSMGVAVLVERGYVLAKGEGPLAAIRDTALHQSTLFFDKITHLRRPAGRTENQAA